jgi:cobalt-zinc-cadmium efflux system membrane fusion protein
MKLYSLLIAFCFSLLLISGGCGDSPNGNTETAVESDSLVQITVQQFEADSMETGEVTRRSFEDEIMCNGYIFAPANGIAQISTPISGIVESIRCAMGDYVKKGQVLASISSNELMIIQQEFAETSAKMKRLKLDYERSKSLFEEKIGAEKDFISIESEYKSMVSKYNSLKLRLQLLKLDIIKIEAGDLYAEFPIIAPISGYITNQNMVLGQYIEQQKNLVEIIDVSQLQLQLSVFENEIGNVKTGQAVRFNTMGAPNSSYSATITSISKAINPDTKNVVCTAKISSGESLNLINRSYVEAHIAVSQKEADALPSEAIIKSGKEYFVYIIEQSDSKRYSLRRQKVQIGKVSQGYTEIISARSITKVLVKGVYNLPAQ